jgi:hypothetical protein
MASLVRNAVKKFDNKKQATLVHRARSAPVTDFGKATHVIGASAVGQSGLSNLFIIGTHQSCEMTAIDGRLT